MPGLLQDLRSAVRTLRQSSGFAVTALLILVIGFTASATTFTLIDSVLVRPLPYPEPERLVMVWEKTLDDSEGRSVVSPANALDWRSQARSFSGFALFNLANLPVKGPEGMERLTGAMVSDDYFDVVGIAPALGGSLSKTSNTSPVSTPIVLSHDTWMRYSGGDREVLGKPFHTTGHSYEVAGVMPPNFRPPEAHFFGRSDFWIPLRVNPQDESRGSRYLRTLARLRPGVGHDDAARELTAIAERLARAYPATNENLGALVVPLHDQIVHEVRPMLLLLVAAVGLVLLIVCANVASLILSRELGRIRDVALRAALGAGRWRIAQRVTIEAVVLGVVGSTLALVVTAWSVAGIVSFWPGLPRAEQVTPGWTVIVFTFIIGIAVSVSFGVLPAIAISRVPPWRALQESSRTGSGGRPQRRLWQALVVIEIAVSLAMLIGGALLVRNFVLLISRDPGFRETGVLTARVDLSAAGNTSMALHRVLDAARATPGVTSAGAVTSLPFYGLNDMEFNVRFQTDRGEAEHLVHFRAVTPGYFEAMGVRLRSGRVHDGSAAIGSPGSGIVNTEVVRQVYGGASPIGRSMRMDYGKRFETKIVGVVDAVRHGGLVSGTEPEIYVPYVDHPLLSTVFVAARTDADPRMILEPLRASIRSARPDVVVDDVQLLHDMVQRSVSTERLNAALMTLLAIAALVLAVVGLYAVVSFDVVSRTREIGIRLALGARPSDVLRGVMKDGLGLIAAGVAAGLVLSVPLAAGISRVLLDVTPYDPAIFLLVPVAVAGAALLATWIPARRASRVDPAGPLRSA